MRKQRPEKIKAKRVSFRNDARVRGAERNSAGLTREALNLEAIFDKPNFEAMNLMEAVVERSNMIKALVQVEKNKGAPGVDGLRVEDLRTYFAKHWMQLKARLLAGDYRPSAVRRVEIPKPDGGVRELGIPTSVDRVIQQAMGQVMSEIFEPTFSEHSYGFRPKRSAQQAVAKATCRGRIDHFINQSPTKRVLAF